MNEQLLNTIIEKIKMDYEGDIAIFAIYGSYVRGDNYETSDIDFYFVPKTEKGKELSTAFILNDIGYDLWALSWERLESMANYKGMVSLIADAKVLYSNCDLDLKQFTELQNKAQNPSDVDFDDEARIAIERSKQYFFDIALNPNFSAQKEAAIRIIESLVYAVALINKTYTHSGWRKSIDEISKMTLVPDRFVELCNSAVCATDSESIANIAKLLISHTEALITNDKGSRNIQNDFHMYYEEAKSLYNKLYNACDGKDKLTSLMVGASLQNEMISMLERDAYLKFGFPDIVSGFTCDSLQEYKNLVVQHEECLIRFLFDNGIKINAYNSFDDFKNNF